MCAAHDLNIRWWIMSRTSVTRAIVHDQAARGSTGYRCGLQFIGSASICIEYTASWIYLLLSASGKCGCGLSVVANARKRVNIWNWAFAIEDNNKLYYFSVRVPHGMMPLASAKERENTFGCAFVCQNTSAASLPIKLWINAFDLSGLALAVALLLFCYIFFIFFFLMVRQAGRIWCVEQHAPS